MSGGSLKYFLFMSILYFTWSKGVRVLDERLAPRNREMEAFWRDIGVESVEVRGGVYRMWLDGDEGRYDGKTWSWDGTEHWVRRHDGDWFEWRVHEDGGVVPTRWPKEKMNKLGAVFEIKSFLLF
mgnify:FL=1